MIISFAYTPEAIEDGSKDVTRRFWNDEYAKRFKAEQVHQAYDKSPRNGGRMIRLIRLTKDPYKEPLRDMTDEHFQREGGTRYWKDKAEYVELMGGPDKIPWVIEFEYVEVSNEGADDIRR